MRTRSATAATAATAPLHDLDPRKKKTPDPSVANTASDHPASVEAPVVPRQTPPSPKEGGIDNSASDPALEAAKEPVLTDKEAPAKRNEVSQAEKDSAPTERNEESPVEKLSAPMDAPPTSSEPNVDDNDTKPVAPEQTDLDRDVDMPDLTDPPDARDEDKAMDHTAPVEAPQKDTEGSPRASGGTTGEGASTIAQVVQVVEERNEAEKADGVDVISTVVETVQYVEKAVLAESDPTEKDTDVVEGSDETPANKGEVKIPEKPSLRQDAPAANPDKPDVDIIADESTQQVTKASGEAQEELSKEKPGQTEMTGADDLDFIFKASQGIGDDPDEEEPDGQQKDVDADVELDSGELAPGESSNSTDESDAIKGVDADRPPVANVAMQTPPAVSRSAPTREPRSRPRTRSQTLSPMRMRRRKSEPASAPASRPSKSKKKKVRRPVVGDRLHVMWHVDDIYYAGVVDNVLSFRGKRFYDITYESREREYYLDLNVRKWRYSNGANDDDEDVQDREGGNEAKEEEDMDENDYPRRGDRVMIMWHVDREYYPGVVVEVLRVGKKLFHDVSYDKGDLEFFLDLRVRKWKYQKDGSGAGAGVEDLKHTESKQAKAQGKQALKLRSGTRRTAPANGRSPTPPSVDTPSSMGDRHVSARRTRASVRDSSPLVDPEKILRAKRRQSAPNPTNDWSGLDISPSQSPSFPPIPSTPPSPPSSLSPLSKVEPLEKSEAGNGNGDDMMLDVLEVLEPPLQTDPSERKKRPRAADIDSIAADLVERKRLKTSLDGEVQSLEKPTEEGGTDEASAKKNVSRALSFENPPSPEASAKTPPIDEPIGSAPETRVLEKASALEKGTVSPEDNIVVRESANEGAPGTSSKNSEGPGVERDFSKAQEAVNPSDSLSTPELSVKQQHLTKTEVRHSETEPSLTKRLGSDQLASVDHPASKGFATSSTDEPRPADPMSDVHPTVELSSPGSEAITRQQSKITSVKERLAGNVQSSERNPDQHVLSKRGTGSRSGAEQGRAHWSRQDGINLRMAERKSLEGSRSARQGTHWVLGRGQRVRPRQSKPKTRVSDIVSVAGMVAKKWAKEQSAALSESIAVVDRQVASIKKVHAATKKLRRQQEREAERYQQRSALNDGDPLTTVDIAETVDIDAHLGDMKVQVVELLTRYRSAVEDREKNLKRQFESIRHQTKSQTSKLQNTFNAVRSLDQNKFQELRQLGSRLKPIVPLPSSAAETGRRYSLPGVSRVEQGLGGDDLMTQDLKNELADVKSQSEYLAKEVKRLQTRERILIEEKERSTAELTRMKYGLDVSKPARTVREHLNSSGAPGSGLPPVKVLAGSAAAVAPAKKRASVKVVESPILQSRAKEMGAATTSKDQMPRSQVIKTSKFTPGRPVGITKKTLKAVPQKSPGRHSGRANRKTLPWSGSKYKPPVSAPSALIKAKEDASRRKPEPSVKPMDIESAIPNVPAQEKASKDFPVQLGKQMDKQAAELLALIVSVWLLQDEGRTEPPKTPGEKQNKWVQGCVKGALRHAYGYLNTCNGGIMTAKRALLDDVDGESVETSWIFAESDDGIDVARSNYSLWEPSLLDEEWIVEKKVLSALNVSLRTAMSLTTAGRFSATIMYAKEIARRALTDFDTMAASNFQRKSSSVPVIRDAQGSPIEPESIPSSAKGKRIDSAQSSVTPLKADLGTSKALNLGTRPSKSKSTKIPNDDGGEVMPPPKVDTSTTPSKNIAPSDRQEKDSDSPSTEKTQSLSAPSTGSNLRIGGTGAAAQATPLHESQSDHKDLVPALARKDLKVQLVKKETDVPLFSTSAVENVQPQESKKSSGEASDGELLQRSTERKSDGSGAMKREGEYLTAKTGRLVTGQNESANLDISVSVQPASTLATNSISARQPKSGRPSRSVKDSVKKVNVVDKLPEENDDLRKAGGVVRESSKQDLVGMHAVSSVVRVDGQTQKTSAESPKSTSNRSSEMVKVNLEARPKAPGNEGSSTDAGNITDSKGKAGEILSKADVPDKAWRVGADSQKAIKAQEGSSGRADSAIPDVLESVPTVAEEKSIANQDFVPAGSIHPQRSEQGGASEAPKDRELDATDLGGFESNASTFPSKRPKETMEKQSLPTVPSGTVENVELPQHIGEKHSSGVQSQGKTGHPVMAMPNIEHEAHLEAAPAPESAQNTSKVAYKLPSSTKNRVYRTKGSAMGVNSAGLLSLSSQTGLARSPSGSAERQQGPTGTSGNVTKLHGDGSTENANVDNVVGALKGVSMKGISMKGLGMKGFNMEPTDIPLPGGVPVRGPFMRSASSPATRRASQNSIVPPAEKRSHVGFKSVSAPPRRRGGGEGLNQNIPGAPFQPRGTDLVQPFERGPQSQLHATSDYARQSSSQDIASKTTAAQDSCRDRGKEGELSQASLFPNEGTYGDLMNPPTPSSFPGLENYIPINENNVAFKRLSNEERESLPATPSDFAADRQAIGGLHSPINFERSAYPNTVDPFSSGNRPLYGSQMGGILHQHPIPSASSGINHLMNPQQQQQQSQQFAQPHLHGSRADPYSGNDSYPGLEQQQGAAFQQRSPFHKGTR